MADIAELLRALHRTPPILVLPNAWDAASARLIEDEGFPAIATTSAGVAAALGYPDGGVVPTNEMIEAVARIAKSVKVPVTADIEHAYGATPDAVADIVLRVIAAGAVGINLEDCVPGATDLEPLALQLDKIKAIIKASTKAGVRIVINARTDGFLRGFGAPGNAARHRDRARPGLSRRRRRLRLRPRRPRRADHRRARQGHRRADQHPRYRRGRRRFRSSQALGVARVSLVRVRCARRWDVLRDIARELKNAGTYRVVYEATR